MTADRGPLGVRVMEAGKDYFTDKAPFTTLDQLADAGTDVVEVADVWPTDPAAPWFSMWAASRARTQGHLIGTPDYERIDELLGN